MCVYVAGFYQCWHQHQWYVGARCLGTVAVQRPPGHPSRGVEGLSAGDIPCGHALCAAAPGHHAASASTAAVQLCFPTTAYAASTSYGLPQRPPATTDISETGM